MRLLYVCNDFGIPPNGTKGASVHLRAITRALADLGHDILLLSPGQGPGEHHPVRRLIPPGCPIADKTSRQLRKWLDDHQLEAAAARELRPLMYNTFAFEAAMAECDDARPHAIIERLSLHSALGHDLARVLGIPYLVEVNALLSEESARFRQLAMAPLAAAIEQRILTDADAVMPVSRALGERVVELGVGPERVHVVPNGADIEMFTDAPAQTSCREALGLADAFVIGFCGSMKIWHGVDDLLTAFSRFAQAHRDARLLLVGDGPELDALRSTTGRLGLSNRVTFTGAVPHEEIPRYLAAMDVAVAPFKHVDNFYFSPIKLFEYMASGTCVVASRLGQIEEVMDDRINGLLFAPEDVDDLARCLLNAYGSQDLRRQLGQAARAAARQRFTWRRAAQTVAGLAESLLSGRESPAHDNSVSAITAHAVRVSA